MMFYYFRQRFHCRCHPSLHVPDKCPIFITQRMIDGGDPNANASGISSKVLDLALTQSVSQQEMAVPKPMSIATR